MLRSASLDADVAPNFDERVIRKVRVQRVREGFGYWSPAILAAGITCMTLLAGMTLLTRPSLVRTAHMPGGEARRMQTPGSLLPALHLSQPPRFSR